jgi:hypothetical protein
MELSLKKRVINLDLYGEKHEVTFPTARQLDRYLKKVQKLADGESKQSDFELTQELLCELGLPKKSSEQMELAHLTELTSVLLDQKKI